MPIWKNTATMLTIGAALICAYSVQAEEKVPEDILDYDTALRCAALHANFALANEDDKTAEKYHDDIAVRWTVMAMLRDESKEDVLEGELFDLVMKLDERIAELGDDQTAVEAFLTKATKSCGELQEYYQGEFESIPLKEE